MLEQQFDRLRAEAGDAVRQPDFDSVRRRSARVRRRRLVTSSAALATVLTVAGLGPAVRGGSGDTGLPAATPSEAGWSRVTTAAATGRDLYSVVVDCAGCGSQLWVSSDGGNAWQRRTEPPEPEDAGDPRMATLTPLAPGILAWSDGRVIPFDEAAGAASARDSGRLWTTTNGGMSWQRAEVGTEPLAAVPAGTHPVDCVLFRVTTCTVGAVDPATGRFAPLAHQPTGITVEPGWGDLITVPADGRLWVPGLDPVTKKPAVAASSDAGRTWRTHVFTDGVAAEFQNGWAPMKYLPRVAAGPGATAYVLIYREDNVAVTQHTSDGGLTWRAGDTIRGADEYGGFVAADGSHIVMTGTGFAAARATGPYSRTGLPGYPGDLSTHLQVTSRQAAEPYLVTSATGPYVSADGRTWRQLPLP
ncbi:hypothetical protein Aab01nite_51080 [Paractinoplanes abujensis]|uniref:Exo-alpha-sialidase n=1 Tax=Paractinoplanes abujensis TaxID=882441 RepID=A0A7W7CSD1_9ACTN|nr:hypothetical protein [Actinoplanes abujensis]MBB4693826.1 hypothetical protein [Actinoplanes abujensis]GID21518.1 hypothetical protein Aab01nite_51080 [Actinoplanes abujensis]